MQEQQKDKKATPEMTLRSVICSIILAGVLGVLNIYSGALTGVYWNGSIVAAVLAYAIFSLSKNKPTILEANMIQTIASAGGAAPVGIFNAYAAGILLGMTFNFNTAVIVLTLGAFMGVLYVVLFRRVLIVEEGLPFPGGIACAETLKVCDSSSDEAKKRAKLLALTGIIATAVVLLRDQLHFIPFYVDLTKHLPEGFVLNIAIYPMMIAIGYIIGVRPAIMFFIGGAVMWWVMGPIGFRMGTFANPQVDPSGLKNWVTSPAVGLIFGGSLMPMILKYKTLINAFRTLVNMEEVKKQDDIPLTSVVWGGAIIGLLTCMYYFAAFRIPVYIMIISFVIIFVAIFVLTRCMGETGLNPGTLIGWATLGIIAFLGLKNPINILLVGAFMMTASGLATDIMTDLKTGYLVGASPRKQIVGEFIGILPGVLAGVFASYIIITAHGLGSPQAPFPMAFAWKGVAEALSGGKSIIEAIPLLVAAVIGAVSTFFGLPGLTAGIAMFLPIGTSIAILLGGLWRLFVQKKYGKEGEERHISTASGFMVGEGFAAFIISIIVFLKAIGA
ncbi:OPT family oligopeptide transporter [Gelria sp. Kuro-4]|uniref:OPT/YSL family transporter n=1 Tax=Gelria sp. Kuro-4 TaxID=2796927 RepID=UPI001BF10772|nr:OPT family oligopeptide transporter [Gelria sp. Kuro-4]BCV25149.1 oligopeptide transporter, OPT family [Gelria sp. Kuro-4]